ncbi:MAG: alpha-L-rhamnosidase, partial [Erysipelotrichaceae bacterium]|nr:alpha-L-rhamnosidase [Erysipelotrichaceae bacterium]
MKMSEYGLPQKWQAEWINPELHIDEEKRQPASVLRRRFSLEETDNAVLYITAHGVYEAYLNGKRAGDFVLAPGTGNYHSRLCVQAYDVSELLVKGDNEIIVCLGDGWYRGSVGIDGLTDYYGKDIALLTQLEVNGKPVLCSDENWQASQSGCIRENDLQKGEIYDARNETITDWHGVKKEDFGYGNLALTESVPVIEQERFEGKLIHTPNGETVIDFGQNLAGYTEIRVHAHEGQTITLWHGETLDENGNFTQENFNPGDRNQNGGIEQKIVYTCKEGLNVYKPHFTIFGFRYAKVETDVDLSDAEFTSIAVYSKMRQTGFFECGNADVNRLFLNSLWSMKSNFCDIPTDCPTRERAGWTGDAQVFAHTAVYLSDCLPVYRKWLDECRYAQKEDGLVQNIAPVNNSGSMISNMLQGSSGWGDACVIVPWTLYQAYGDRTILEENYDMMTKWVDFSLGRAKDTRPQYQDNPYKEYLVDQGFHFGEWCQPG